MEKESKRKPVKKPLNPPIVREVCKSSYSVIIGIAAENIKAGDTVQIDSKGLIRVSGPTLEPGKKYLIADRAILMTLGVDDDGESYDFAFRADGPVKQIIHQLRDMNLGCKLYVEIVKK